MNITGTGNGRVAGVFLKTVNVSLQLGAGDVFERCELKLNLGEILESLMMVFNFQ